ncbi:MAG TPA: hypothetical protein VIS77_04240, partial [Burkholderiales bacterium]
ERVRDDDFLILFNTDHDAIAFTIPDLADGPWRTVFDTLHEAPDPVAGGDAAGQPGPPPVPEGDRRARPWKAGEPYPLGGRALALLTRSAAAA